MSLTEAVGLICGGIALDNGLCVLEIDLDALILLVCEDEARFEGVNEIDFVMEAVTEGGGDLVGVSDRVSDLDGVIDFEIDFFGLTTCARRPCGCCGVVVVDSCIEVGKQLSRSEPTHATFVLVQIAKQIIKDTAAMTARMLQFGVRGD